MSDVEGGNERENEGPAKENASPSTPVKENASPSTPVKESVSSSTPVKENTPSSPVKENVSLASPKSPVKENAGDGKKEEAKAPIDLSKWLADNKLTNKEKEIKERNLTVEQMADMNESQFKELADGIGLDTLARKRFEKALRQLKPGANNNNNNNSSNVQPVQVVAVNQNTYGPFGGLGPIQYRQKEDGTTAVVTPQEHEMVTQLYERFVRTSLLIQNLNGCSQVLELGAKLCKDDINKKIDMAIQRLLERKNVLKEDMIRIRVEKSDKLDQQLQVLRSYQRELEDGKKVYEKTIADSSLDVHIRKKKIIGLVNELTGRKDIQLTLVTQPKLRLGYENQMLTAFLDQLGIDDCDQPNQPALKIAKISFDSIAVELTCDDEILVHKVTEYAVEIALIHTNSKQKPVKRKLDVGKKKKKSKDKDKDKDKDKKKKKKKGKGSDSDESKSDESGSDKDSEENSDEEKDSEEEDSEKESEENSDAEDSDEKEESAEEESEEQSDEDDKKKKKKKKDKDKDKADDAEPKEDKKEVKTETTPTTSTTVTSGESKTETQDSNTDKDKDKDKESKKEKTEVAEVFDINNVDMSKLEWELAGVVEVPEKYLEVGRYSASRKYPCVVKQLLDQSDYAVRARAKNSSGWGDFCNPQIFNTKKLIIDSKILKPEEKKQLLRWLPSGDRKKRWKLMFRGSKHGFGASQFHAKLDNKPGITVTVIQSTMNHVFGGYTTVAWTSSGNYASDTNSWIFLVRAGKNVTPKKGKWKVTQTQYSVYHGGGNGPSFGGGYDFCLANASNTNTSSYANAGHSYACPKNNTLLAGQYNFMVKDFEVFMLTK